MLCCLHALGRAGTSETQQGQVQGPAPGKEEPGAPLHGGGQPAGKQLCWEVPGVLVADLSMSSAFTAKKGRVSWGVLVKSLPEG